MDTALHLVDLDRDHPGFRDPIYRARRDEIARAALAHREGAAPPRIAYTAAEHGVWRTALAHLAPLHERLACAAFTREFPRLGFAPDAIPDFADVNARLAGSTGFALAPVAGLVEPREFMEHLARGLFLATQYIRHDSAPLYTPEPDVIHELVGHAALLADPEFARVNRLFGEAIPATRDADTVQALIRLYWYALEFGAVREGGALKVVGAGLLSSFGELGRFESHARLRPFDVAAVASTPFDPTDYQGVIFVAESQAAMFRALEGFLAAVIARG